MCSQTHSEQFVLSSLLELGWLACHWSALRVYTRPEGVSADTFHFLRLQAPLAASLSNYVLLIREKDMRLQVKEHKTPLSLGGFLSYASHAHYFFHFLSFSPFSLTPFFSSPGISRILMDPVYSFGAEVENVLASSRGKVEWRKAPKAKRVGGGGGSKFSPVAVVLT